MLLLVWIAYTDTLAQNECGEGIEVKTKKKHCGITEGWKNGNLNWYYFVSNGWIGFFISSKSKLHKRRKLHRLHISHGMPNHRAINSKHLLQINFNVDNFIFDGHQPITATFNDDFLWHKCCDHSYIFFFSFNNSDPYNQITSHFRSK